METEISVNGKILMPLTGTEKFDTETDKFGHVCFCFRCISVSRHYEGFMYNVIW